MQNQVSWHYVRSATGKSKSHFHAYQGTLRAAQSVRSSSCCSSLFSWFLHVQPDNKLKCRSVLSTWAPSHLPLLLWGALRRGRGWCSMGQCVNKMHSVVRGCKQVFLSFFGSSLFFSSSSTSSSRCCHCSCRRFVWNVADKPLESVCAVCVVCCLPADVFHKKSKWQVFPAAARCFTHFTQLPKLCRLEMSEEKLKGEKRRKRLKCKWGKQIVGQPRLAQTDWLPGPTGLGSSWCRLTGCFCFIVSKTGLLCPAL